MKQIHTFLTGLFCLAMCASTFGQITFTEQTDLLVHSNVSSGVAIGVADMNGDGLDDILRMDDGSQLVIEFQSPDGQPFTSLDYGSTQGFPWAVAAADANNDGYCDIMVGGSYDNVKYLQNMGNGTDFDLAVLPNSNIFVQGSNFADINNDGNLDIFNCHDDAESRIFAGDGLGNFTNADEWIDMATVPASDNSGNYGSVWTDFDNDRDLDLYIAKCRIGVINPEDPRRINALFVNDGESNYKEDAERHGLKVKHQSWTADFGDIDNDGDLDCFITNHDHTLQLLENDGAGHFTDISQEAGIAGGGNNINYVQGIMRDLDNDGFLDLIVAQPSLFFRNNGDKTFTQVFPAVSSFGTVAAGDLNHDGFVDLFTAYQNGFNNPSGNPDRLWMNNGNDNHYLSVSLQGTESNRSGVGARIEAHGPWGIQIREVRAGESYGITNSLTKTFGLADATMVDHLVVHWPSGHVDVLTDVPADQCITIEEGTTCLLSDFQLDLDGDAIICAGESVTMAAPAGYTYLWSDGSTGQMLTVTAEGNFSVVIVDNMGCVAASEVVNIIASPDETPTIEAFGETEFCEGGDVVLISSEADAYTWSNGETGENIIVSQTGDYFVTVPGACGDYSSEPIHVEVVPYAPTPDIADQNIIEGTAATLEVNNGIEPHWYDSESATEPLAIGTTYETDLLFEETVFYVEDVNSFGGGDFPTGMAEHQGSSWNGNNFNGQTIFDALEYFILREITVSTDQPGEREIQLLDVDDNVLASGLFDLEAGETTLALNFEVFPGLGYRLVTNTEVNQITLGTDSPRLRRSDEGVSYPYEVPGVLSINGSNYGPGFYYYFFDWQVEIPSLDCLSDRVPVTVSVGPNAINEVEPFGNLSVQPNPSNGRFLLNLTALESGNAQLSITDLRGRQVYAENFAAAQGVKQSLEIDLGTVPHGMYFLKVTSGERAGWLKLVID